MDAINYKTAQNVHQESLENMLYILSFDWFGKLEVLDEWDTSLKKTCQEMKGIKYMGRWAPNNARYHWCYIFETDDYGKPTAALNKARPGYTRDYSKVTHSIVEVYSGPVDKTKL